eukprot:gene3538-3779_t
MTTELQRQVAQLQSRNIQHQSLQHGRPSIFLTAKEAAAVDVSTVYEAAVTGLKVLIQYDNRFEKFLTGILHTSSVDIQRELKTREENDQLDQEIDKLLNLLSLWAFEPNAHLVLEYLIRRFLIHEFNTNALLKCMLVAHDTKIFGRILQLCKIKESRWSFLSSYKESGAPVPRDYLVKRIIKSSWIVEVICNTALSAFNLIGIRKGTSSSFSSLVVKGAEKILSFVTALLIETAEQVAFDDIKMRNVYLFLLEGLKISNNNIFNVEQTRILVDWKCSCCLILSQLARKTPFAESLQRVLGNGFAECIKKSGLFSAELEDIILQSTFTTLSILADRGSLEYTRKLLQEFVELDKKLSPGDENESFFKIYMSDVEDSTLISRIFGKAVDYLIEGDVESENKSSSEGFKIHPSDLERLISSLSMQDSLTNDILSFGLQQLLVASTKDENYTSTAFSSIKNIVKVISNRHPRVFDEVVTSLYQSNNQLSLLDSNESNHSSSTNGSSNLSEKLTSFLGDLFQNDSFSSTLLSSDNLYMALHSPVKQIRVEALKRVAAYNFEEKEDNEETRGLLEAVFTLLEDIDDEVAIAVWNKQIVSLLLRFFPQDRLVTTFQSVLSWWFTQINESNQENHVTVLYKILQSLNDDHIQKTLFADVHHEFTLWLLQWCISFLLGPIEFIIESTSAVQQSKSYYKLKKISYELLQKTKFISAGAKEKDILDKKDTKSLLNLKLSESWTKKTDSFLLLIDSVRSNQNNLPYFIRVSLLSLFNQFDSSALKVTQASSLKKSLLEVAISLVQHYSEQNKVIQEFSVEVLKGFFLLYRSVAAIDNQKEGKKRADSKQSNSLAALLKVNVELNEEFHLNVKPGLEFFCWICLSLDSKLLEFVDEALMTLFHNSKHHYLWYLIQLLTNSSLIKSLPVLSTLDELQVVQAISLQIINLSLDSVVVSSSKGKSKSKEISSRFPEQNLLLIVLLPLLLSAASNKFYKIRVLALKAAETVVSLNVSGEETLDTHIVVNWTAIKAFSNLLVQKSKIIQSSNDAIVGVVLDAFANPEGSAELKTELWKVTSLIYGNMNYDNLLSNLMNLLPGTDVQEDQLPYLIDTLQRSVNIAASENYLSALFKLFKSSLKLATTNNDNKSLSLDIKFIQDIISESYKASAVSLHDVKKQLLQLIAEGSLSAVEKAVVSNLSSLLFQQYLSDVGNSDYLDALSVLPLDEEIILHELQVSQQQFTKLLSSTRDHDEDFDERSRIIEKLGSLLEAFIRGASTNEAKANNLTTSKAILTVLFDIFTQAREVTKRWGVGLDFLNTLLIEAIYQLIALLDGRNALYSSAVVNTAITPAKKGSKVKAPATVSDFYYVDAQHILVDISSIIASLQLISAFQFHSFVFKVFVILLKAEKTHAHYILDESSKLFSSLQNQITFEKYLSQVLQMRKIYLKLCPEDLASKESLATMQIIAHRLFGSNFLDNSQQERQQVLRLLLKLTGDEEEEEVFVATYNSIICQTIASYQENSAAAKQQINQNIDTVALSRSAQRRAKRAIISSLPEQLYQLSHFLFFHMSTETQVTLLTTLITTAQQYFLAALHSKDGQSADKSFVLESLKFVHNQINSHKMEVDGDAEEKGEEEEGTEYAASISMIYLEFILEILENKKFHRNLVRFIHQAETLIKGKSNDPTSLSVQSLVQQQLLELADTFLQYMVLIENTKTQYGPSQDTEKVSLRLEQDVYSISKYAVAEIMFEGCLNCIHGFQSLLDIPSFISIIQELLNHDLLSVRQRAIVILKDRLQETPIEKSADIQLYHELFARMKSITTEYLTSLISESASKGKESRQSQGQIPLVQSAIMCADILLQHMGKNKAWKNEIVAFMDSIVKAIPVIYQNSIAKKSLSELSAISLDQKKLLGSMLLCQATIYRMLGANMLAYLPKSVELLIGIYESETNHWHLIDTNKKLKSIPEVKSQLLFFRTLILSMTIITSEMANFIHSFLPKILTLLFQTFSKVVISEGDNSEYEESIYVDLEQFSLAILNHVPLRLIAPHVSNIIHSVYPVGVAASLQLVKWVQQIVTAADRTVIVNSLSQWINISTDLLSYRSKSFADVTTEDIEEVELTASAIVSEISLKLTEKELKAFTLKLLEWKNREEDNSVSEVSFTSKKGIAFYTVVNELSNKLKNLFNSTMGLLWDDYLETLTAVKDTISDKIEKAQSESASKKRKKLLELRSKLSSEENQEVIVYEKYNTILFTIIQTLSDHGNNTFINETRYDSLYPIVLNYVPLREIFETDDDYLQFNVELITQTLTSLCVSVSRDLLWKPLNYQLLLQTRNNLSIVRKTAILIIGKLFQEVGDEYLHLLPECIQFISELLEDSNSDVVAATRETINIIEDLSGEKLDAYLAH